MGLVESAAVFLVSHVCDGCGAMWKSTCEPERAYIYPPTYVRDILSKSYCGECGGRILWETAPADAELARRRQEAAP